MAKRGRKSFRTEAQIQLAREISSLGTRLSKRLANVESKCLSNIHWVNSYPLQSCKSQSST